ncbi:MAG: cytochrome c biogenesis protein ResB [Verrucomicrobiales bacterium]|nr:cytochrome c biogenesis protein ResB [Verrucomicrobiales bacterium]
MAKPPLDWSPGNWPRLFYRFFTSFKLATVILILMTLATLLGTLGQVENGLHAAKVKYFYSFFFSEKLFGTIPVILPGGLLLMILLFVNMTLGALIKVRKRWKGAGLLISHFGMLMLLVGGFVTWAFSTDGFMALYPGMSSNRVESYREWQLEIVPLSKEGVGEKAWIYPAEMLDQVRSDEQCIIKAHSLPFDVVLNGYSKNATPIPTSAPMAAGVTGKEIDGFKLSPQKPSKEAEQNLPGCFIEFRPLDGSAPIETILWAGSYRFDPREKPMPFSFKVGDQLYGALLVKKSWTVPFEVRLDEFIFERHPGVSMARNYESRVTRVEASEPDKAIEIKMNEPMRHAGYTFFQESFGPSGSQPGDEMFSQFAVANNPADQWPLYALIINGIGLGIHFMIMLVNFSIRSRNKNTQAAIS